MATTTTSQNQYKETKQKSVNISPSRNQQVISAINSAMAGKQKQHSMVVGFNSQGNGGIHTKINTVSCRYNFSHASSANPVLSSITAFSPVEGSPYLSGAVTTGTSPSECSPCNTLFDVTPAAPWPSSGTKTSGIVGTSPVSWKYKLHWNRSQYCDESSMPATIQEWKTSNGVAEQLWETTEQFTRVMQKSGSCNCCCCDCLKAGHPPITLPCPSGQVASGVPYSAGAGCSGALTWASDILCPVCVYPNV